MLPAAGLCRVMTPDVIRHPYTQCHKPSKQLFGAIPTMALSEQPSIEISRDQRSEISQGQGSCVTHEKFISPISPISMGTDKCGC